MLTIGGASRAYTPVSASPPSRAHAMELLVSLALGLSVWFLLPGERPALIERPGRTDRAEPGRDSGVFSLPSDRDDETRPGAPR